MRKIIITIVCIIALAAIGWYVYSINRQTPKGVPRVDDFSTFFPVGDNGDPTAINGVIPTIVDTPSGSGTLSSAFKQLSPHAVAGYGVFNKTVPVLQPMNPLKPTAKPVYLPVVTNFLRYVSRSNGYVYEIEGSSIPLQITNVYIPNIYEAVFADAYTTSLLRFLRPDGQTIASYSVPIPPSNTDGSRTQKEGVYLPDNVAALIPSPDGASVARSIIDPNGATIQLTNSAGAKKTDVIRTPFREWILSWPQAKSLYLQTKASAQVPGYLYRIDTGEKRLRRVLGNISGLTTSVSPTGTYILYSQTSNNSFVTHILNTKTNTTRTLNLQILPEKCAWLKNEDLICAGNTQIPEDVYPDAWYQGTRTLSDKLYRVYTGSLVFDTLYDNSATSFDMTNVQVNEPFSTVYFIDKPSGILWQMKY